MIYEIVFAPLKLRKEVNGNSKPCVASKEQEYKIALSKYGWVQAEN